MKLKRSEPVQNDDNNINQMGVRDYKKDAGMRMNRKRLLMVLVLKKLNVIRFQIFYNGI